MIHYFVGWVRHQRNPTLESLQAINRVWLHIVLCDSCITFFEITITTNNRHNPYPTTGIIPTQRIPTQPTTNNRHNPYPTTNLLKFKSPGLTAPCSVIILVINSAGVTSKAGL